MALARPRPVEPEDDKRMELHEHLGELRTRIIRCVVYIAAAGTACYYLFKPLYNFLIRPMREALRQHNLSSEHIIWSRYGFTPQQSQGLRVLERPALEWRLVFHNFTDAFFVVLKICIVAGIIFSLPLLILEVYGFIAPALTRAEKRPLRYVVPLSVTLFAAGVVLAYWVSTFAITWFVGYIALFDNSILLQDPQPYILFMLKMMGVFGLVFQLPVLLMFLAWVGILTSKGMKKTWRHAIVGISVVGLVVTPSNDVFTMLVMIIPVIVLYISSIWLVAFIEKRRSRVARDS